jgi:ATP/maltotriose-dependent transcriptional regulator MalT
MEECVALARGREPVLAGVARSILGALAWERGDLDRAMTLFEEAVGLVRAGGEPGLAAYFVINLGALAAESGDLERAMALFEETLGQAQRAGADMVVGEVLLEKVNMARRSGDLAHAERLGREQLLVFHRMGARHLLASNLEALACTAAASADGVRAVAIAQCCDGLCSAFPKPGRITPHCSLLPRRLDAGVDGLASRLP